MTRVTPVNGTIDLGRAGEHLAREVVLPLEDIAIGEGHALLLHQRSGDHDPYPVETITQGMSLIWPVTNADTGIFGHGCAEVRWLGEDGSIIKSQEYMTITQHALHEPGEPPEGHEGYVNAVARNAKYVADAMAGAEAAKETAEASASDAAASAQGAADAMAGAEAAKEASEASASAAAASSQVAADAMAGAEAAMKDADTSATAAKEAANESQALYQQVQEDLAEGKLKGDRGDALFAAFEVTDDGHLHLLGAENTGGLTFSLNEDTGNLEVNYG